MEPEWNDEKFNNFFTSETFRSEWPQNRTVKDLIEMDAGQTVCQRLPMSANVCQCLPASANVCQCLPMSANVCHRHAVRKIVRTVIKAWEVSIFYSLVWIKLFVCSQTISAKPTPTPTPTPNSASHSKKQLRQEKKSKLIPEIKARVRLQPEVGGEGTERGWKQKKLNNKFFSVASGKLSKRIFFPICE